MCMRTAAIKNRGIDKEANRWEEQFYLGEDEDAQISYGLLPSSDAFHDRLSRFVGRFGLSRVAEWAGVSRRALTKLCKTRSVPTHRMRERLEEAFVILDGYEARDREQKEKKLLRLRQRAPPRSDISSLRPSLAWIGPTFRQCLREEGELRNSNA
jgi:hypothetical protein